MRAVPAFGATMNATDPLPVPLAPDVTVIQFAVLFAVQLQPAPAVTVTVPVPPRTPREAFGGAIA